ncbi:TPA: Arc family DNA-binding protein [Stenotrophomonas maltophilia]|nr:Arc family DNA-binding protein [Stenotrophomonas maltophilia]
MKARVQDEYVRTSLRLPQDLHARVHDAARCTGRTFNAEIIAKLSLSFGSGLDKLTAERLIEALQSYVSKT